MSQDFLFQQIYDVVAQIPSGKVATYGQIADMVGRPRGARTVGWALHSVPEHLGLPCHRVINQSGELAPKHVFGGYEIQRELLESEGVKFESNGKVDLEKCLWCP